MEYQFKLQPVLTAPPVVIQLSRSGDVSFLIGRCNPREIG